MMWNIIFFAPVYFGCQPWVDYDICIPQPLKKYIQHTQTHRYLYIYILSNIVDPAELIKAKEDYKIIGH